MPLLSPIQNSSWVKYPNLALYTADHCLSEVTDQKLVTWLVFEEAIASKLQPIEMWKNDWAVKFNIPEENNNSQNSSCKSSNFIISGSANKLNKQKSTKSSEKSSVTSESIEKSNFKEEVKENKALTASHNNINEESIKNDVEIISDTIPLKLKTIKIKYKWEIKFNFYIVLHFFIFGLQVLNNFLKKIIQVHLYSYWL